MILRYDDLAASLEHDLRLVVLIDKSIAATLYRQGVMLSVLEARRPAHDTTCTQSTGLWQPTPTTCKLNEV